ncbi:hypothetical protein PR202_gb26401 [Eleusine coracana subsp. coracana]|uniref:Uncharacterized protein n=1 Tax=Eleusine coracana subsp. coracana TaxID=191504 RepID=A0AAV5FRR9_ELECO|nr:hypothetical protein PR202_gb26401 [Eleusine coracana subsp. coracana]
MRKAAATPPGGTPTMKMKLLIDTVAQRVLFAEAGKDVIDFIFGILAMPMSAILKLVADDDADAFGSVPNVYASVEKMDDAHMQCKNARDVLLADPGSGSGSGSAESDDDDDGYASYSAPPPPKTPPAPDTSLNSQPEPIQALPVYLYRCDTCRARHYALSTGGGFVQGVATYTIMDDLTVTPTSGISSVALLKDLDAVEERTVNIGHHQALGIIKAALHSKSVLTDALLVKKN